MYPAFEERWIDRWPRWVARMGLPAWPRARWREDETELPIQVLTIVPSLPSAPCLTTGRKGLAGRGLRRAPPRRLTEAADSSRRIAASPRRCGRFWRPVRRPRP